MVYSFVFGLVIECGFLTLVLDSDASNSFIGAVLSKVQNGQERVIGYYSKVLSSLKQCANLLSTTVFILT